MENSEVLVHNPIVTMYNSCLNNNSEKDIECSSITVNLQNETKKMLSEVPVKSALNGSDIKEINEQEVCKLLDENKDMKTIDLPCVVESPIQDCESSLGSRKLQYSTFDCSFHVDESTSDTMQQSETLNQIVELIDDKTLHESTPTISSISNPNQENEFFSSALNDGDENTTQLRLDSCNFPNGYDQNHELVELHNISIESSLIGSSPDSTYDLFNEISCFAPYDEKLHKDILSSSSNLNPTNTNNGKNSSLKSICSFMQAESMSATVKEPFTNSGVASLPDSETLSNTTSSICDNDTISKLPVLGRKSSLPCRKRPHSCISKLDGSKKSKPDSKRKVTFNGVTIFYFQRKQSFVSVPSQGGSTLGMGLQHILSKQLSLNQHKRSILSYRKRVVKERQQQQRLDEKLRELKETHPDLDANQLMLMINDSNQEEEISDSSSDEYCEDDDRVPDVSEDEEDFYFLQPISAKKRRMLLRMAGVQRIDSDEKFENKATRESREICGCDCEGVCLPARCQCALAGIPCQVDRQSFPCGCVVSGCQNRSGRVEFDADRVRNHYFQTMRRLRLEETGCLPPQNSMETLNRPQPQKSPYVLSAIPENANTTSSIETGATTSLSQPGQAEHQENGSRLDQDISTTEASHTAAIPEPWQTINNSSLDGGSHPTLSSPSSTSGGYAESYISCENARTSSSKNIATTGQNPRLASSQQDDFIPQTIYPTTASSEQHLETSFSQLSSDIDSVPTSSNGLKSGFPVNLPLSHDVTKLKKTLKLDPIASLLPMYNSPMPRHEVSQAHNSLPTTGYFGASNEAARLPCATTLTSSPGPSCHDWTCLSHVTSASQDYESP